MKAAFHSILLQSTGASAYKEAAVIQELWSGYGKIIRYELEGAPMQSVVVKHVQLPSTANHPRGWNSDIGHQRKLKSYRVETEWYKSYSKDSRAGLPECLAIETADDEVFMVLEDLDAAGFPLRKTNVVWNEICNCLEWLAKFHAANMGKEPLGLWATGTYWHLATRPQELEALDDQRIKNTAPLIDRKLNDCRYQTFVHGDAKLANFCFAEDGNVAAVDFQYVGGGCGMKDVAYFVGSCLYEADCERLEDEILDTYFSFLRNELPDSAAAIEAEWRPLYRVAWADFHRFLKGWSPQHWKINSYSERVLMEVIDELQ